MSTATRTNKSSKLRKYLATKRKNTYLLGSVERWLISRPMSSDRRTDVLHPSEITKSTWCIRESWFLLNGAEKPPEFIGMQLQSIFDVGHAIHGKWQRWLEQMDVLIGVWECQEHGQWWGRRSDDCERCPSVSYKEVPVLHEDLWISGHADGWVVLEDKPPALLEIKSIGMGTLRMGKAPIDASGSLAKSFALLERPIDAHVRQASLYVYCLRWMHSNGIIEDPPPEHIVFVYECKEDSSSRDFLIPYDESVLEPTLAKAEILAAATEPPECTGGKNCGCARYA